MPNANYVMLMGHVTRDPQQRFTPSGSAVTEVGLAVNRYWNNKQTGQREESTTFVDITFWNKTAELIVELGVSKGDPLQIEGRLDLDQWQDKETGQARSKLKVVGDKFQTLKPRDPNPQAGRQSPPDRYQGNAEGGQAQQGNLGYSTPGTDMPY